MMSEIFSLGSAWRCSCLRKCNIFQFTPRPTVGQIKRYFDGLIFGDTVNVFVIAVRLNVQRRFATEKPPKIVKYLYYYF